MESNNIFITDIEKIRINTDSTYLEAIMLYCTNNDIDIESIAMLIKKDLSLKDKLQKECEEIHLLKHSSNDHTTSNI
jgi:uncharacterized membrane protein